MILLSALLASLTGLVAGERPAQRAHVELSAVAAAVQPGNVAARTNRIPANGLPRLDRAMPVGARADHAMPVRGGRLLLNLKQSWLN
jgi:hypothetical protein